MQRARAAEQLTWWSTGTTVRDNVLVDKTGYRPEKNQASVAVNVPQGSPTCGNTVTGNCISTGAPAIAGLSALPTSDGRTAPWIAYDGGRAAQTVTFNGLSTGTYHLVVESFAWSTDGQVTTTVQAMPGSTSAAWCRA